MDVDLLRPGTVPIPPETILWFEFLLNPNLLKVHLSKVDADPSPCDLIIKFFTVNREPQQRLQEAAALNANNISNNHAVNSNGRTIDIDALPDSPPLSIVETERYTRKNLAIKILCLKVAAYLKWNLNILETTLPPHIQFQLMQDLIYMATDGNYSTPPQNISEDMLQYSGVCFSMVLYHRWLLRFLINRALLARQTKQDLTLGVMSAEYAQASFERLVRHSEETRKYSLQFLTELTEKQINKEYLKIPTIDSFASLTEDINELTHDWENAVCLANENEFLMQVNYDLCSNYFFYGQYDLAEKHILLCNQHKEKLLSRRDFDWSKVEYASVTEGEIKGYMNALNIKNEHNGLLHAVEQSISDNYSNLLSVFQEDNVRKEIPLAHRIVIELDIQGSSSSGIFTVSRDFANKLAVLNAVRSVLEGDLPSNYIDFNKRLKQLGSKFMELLFWAFQPVLASPNISHNDLIKIKTFFLHLATSEHAVCPKEVNKFIATYVNDKLKKDDPMCVQLFNASEIDEITRELSEFSTTNDLPPELLTTDWDTPDLDVRNDEDLNVGYLRQKLIDATTADEVRQCLVKLAPTKISHPLWTANPQWKLPAPIQSVVMALPGGFQQDFSYILLGKARQFSEMGDHKAAIELLLILEAHLNQAGNSNPIVFKLLKLVGWEGLYLRITQILADWQHHKIIVSNMSALVNKSTMCLIASNSNDPIQPRQEVREMCCMLLLNTCEWNTLVEGPARVSGPSEALAAAALVFQQATRSRSSKKMPKDLWDMVLPIFASNYYGNPNKRNSSGNSAYQQSSRDNQQQNNKMKDGMMVFFSKLREPTVLTVVISLLARLFNILTDDSNLDLTMEYIHLWPSSVPTSTFFSAKAVSETLHHLVTQALSYYPSNISWIKLLGDINLVGGHYSAAMKQYLSALTIMSDYFIQPLSKQVVEDQTIFQKMIKCCTHLNCPTQAAILCQFLDEIDYGLAFKCLAEMSYLCSDAMDSYYGCIWDTTILEYLINLHHKKGETHRKQLAVKVMGMLELNSNNNEEIQREAANSRKAKFMRALVRQYMC